MLDQIVPPTLGEPTTPIVVTNARKPGTVLDDIQAFINAQPPSDILARWTPGMETQVNVDPSKGERLDKGQYVDGTTTFWNIRIPKNADSDPQWDDYTLAWPLNRYVQAIGSTGWDWQRRVSRWVGFDFDAITGHAAGVGISAEQLERVRAAALALDYGESRNSSGGGGIHMYVHLDDVPTANHTEHAALARAVLSIMSTDAGFDFASQVDACGGNMWFWHKKATKENGGFTLLKAATRKLAVPDTWRDHIDVVTRKRTKVRVRGVDDETSFEALASARKRVPLDDKHKAIIDALAGSGYSTNWVSDHHLLQTHTCALAELPDMAGFFETNSTGSDPGSPNCFMFPLPNGAWKAVRFAQGHREADTWTQDGTSWTWCYFNRQPDLATACRAFGGSERKDGGFQFESLESARAALASMGQALEVSTPLLQRQTLLKEMKTGGRVLVAVKQVDGNACPGKGWTKEKGGWWERILSVRLPDAAETERDHDDDVRIVVTPSGEHVGAFVRSADGRWDRHSIANAKTYKQGQGFSARDAAEIIGQAMHDRWETVSLPFQPEYPGGRLWNMGAAQLCFPPATDRDAGHPHWDLILNHIGQTLTRTLGELPWAVQSGIRTGGEYLLANMAAIIREPFKPTPYLFLWGPENSGKSILWEAFAQLVTRGVVRADRVLTGHNEFNGELVGAILCAVEERDVSKTPGARSRIKDLVTAKTLSIRRMRTDAYSMPNTSHWWQFANNADACPVFPGDTRITVIYVPPLPAGSEVPKEVLLERLTEEGPAFLRTLLDFELPAPIGRLRIPIVETEHKKHVQEQFRDPVEQFINECCFHVPGQKLLFSEFFDRFHVWLEPESRPAWSKQKVSKTLPPFPNGVCEDNKKYVGNLSWENAAADDPEAWVVVSGKLTRQINTATEQVPRFVAARCVLEPTARIGKAAIYEAFREWCAGEGLIPTDNNRFGRALMLVGEIRNDVKVSGVNGYEGIRVS